MTNEQDYMLVEGNFDMNTPYRHTGRFTAGILELKGNFTYIADNPTASFDATGTHKVILSGNQKQTAYFSNPGEGTVFIAGIDHLPPFLQYKFSRLLSAWLSDLQIKGENISAGQLRVIASTSRNLQELVDRGIFSAELFSLLRTTTIFLPPLRQRRECIPALVDHFIGYFNSRHGKAVRGIRLATMTLLQQYDWPGNVRELRHAVSYAVQCETSSLLTPTHLPVEICQQNSFSDRCLGDLAGTVTTEPSWITLPPDGITLEGVEKKLIEQALQRFSGNQSKAARCLGMSRDTIRYRIKKFGLGRKGST
jgi:DNA-binding NtrC family response regulator